MEPSFDYSAIGEWYARHRFGVAFTVGNTGELAKRVTKKGWQLKARAYTDVGAAAEHFAAMLPVRNPAIVCNPEGDPNAQAYVIIEVDGKQDIDRFGGYGPPEALTIKSSGEHRFHFIFKPPPGDVAMYKI
jgi:hypothetical protein